MADARFTFASDADLTWLYRYTGTACRRLLGRLDDDFVQETVAAVWVSMSGKRKIDRKLIRTAVWRKLRGVLRGTRLASGRKKGENAVDLLDKSVRMGARANRGTDAVAKREPVSTYDDNGNLIDARMAWVPTACVHNEDLATLAEEYATENWAQWDETRNDLIPPAIASLPKKLRKTAALLAEGATQVETAKLLKCTTRTVRNRITQIRTHLQDSLHGRGWTKACRLQDLLSTPVSTPQPQETGVAKSCRSHVLRWTDSYATCYGESFDDTTVASIEIAAESRETWAYTPPTATYVTYDRLRCSHVPTKRWYDSLRPATAEPAAEPARNRDRNRDLADMISAGLQAQTDARRGLRWTGYAWDLDSVVDHQNLLVGTGVAERFLCQ